MSQTESSPQQPHQPTNALTHHMATKADTHETPDDDNREHVMNRKDTILGVTCFRLTSYLHDIKKREPKSLRTYEKSLMKCGVFLILKRVLVRLFHKQ